MPPRNVSSRYFASLKERVAALERALNDLGEAVDLNQRWARDVYATLDHRIDELARRVGRLELLADAR